MAHGDLTGNKKAELQEAVAAEQAAKAASISMATAAIEAEKSDEPVELQTVESQPKPVLDGEVEITSVDETEPIKTFKVNTDLDNVTIGYGNTYNFERGRTYKAPKSVYDYLEEKGLVWH